MVYRCKIFFNTSTNYEVNLPTSTTPNYRSDSIWSSLLSTETRQRRPGRMMTPDKRCIIILCMHTPPHLQSALLLMIWNFCNVQSSSEPCILSLTTRSDRDRGRLCDCSGTSSPLWFFLHINHSVIVRISAEDFAA